MNYTTKFNNGQRVWVVSSGEHYRIVRCVTCNCSGKVFIRDEEFICPACEGRSSRRNYAGQKFYVAHEGEVGKVSIEDQVGGYDPKMRITYMIDTTGVGSGTVWDESRTFASRAEADEFVGRMNGALAKDEDIKQPAYREEGR